MRYFVILALGTLAACSSAGAQEEEKYKIVEREARNNYGMYKYKALCPNAQAVAKAYLQDRNEEKYKQWKVIADQNCRLSNDPFAK